MARRALRLDTPGAQVEAILRANGIVLVSHLAISLEQVRGDDAATATPPAGSPAPPASESEAGAVSRGLPSFSRWLCPHQAPALVRGTRVILARLAGPAPQTTSGGP
jgi:hypothetical protein